MLAGNKDPLKAPKGVRNLAETIVEFIEDQIVMQTMGKEGLVWTPFLLSLFIFVYLCNLPGIIPILQMPATARMAIPLFLALLVWVVYNAVGFKHKGSATSPACRGRPACRWPCSRSSASSSSSPTSSSAPSRWPSDSSPTCSPATCCWSRSRFLSDALFTAEHEQFVLVPMGILPLFMLVFLTAFEVLVGFLQAYIFLILTCVYIDAAQHPEH